MYMCATFRGAMGVDVHLNSTDVMDAGQQFTFLKPRKDVLHNGINEVTTETQALAKRNISGQSIVFRRFVVSVKRSGNGLRHKE